jgi:putative CocE/NonD family hydrolase
MGAMRRQSFYLAMHDGVKIAVDLCLPDRARSGSRLPTILHQTRYWRAIDFRWPVGLFSGLNMYDMLKIRPAFLSHGYAWISMDVRGSGASYGHQTGPYPAEAVEDVRQVADWIVGQAWSNGRIGVYGISYDGLTAISALRARHPAILACAPTYTVFDLYPDIAGIGGVPFSWFHRTWGLGTKALDANKVGFYAGLLPKLVARGVRPVDADRRRKLLMQAIGDHARNWDVHETSFRVNYRDDSLPYDPGWSLDSFSPHSHLEEIAASGAAVYLYSGWLDAGFQHAAIRYFLNLKNPGSRLTIGPWDHGGRYNVSPTIQRKSDYRQHILDLLHFFGAHLNGAEVADGIPGQGSVRYFTLGEDLWKEAETWPPPNSHAITYYLAAGNALSPSRPIGAEGSDAYRVDYSAGTGQASRWDSLIGGLHNPKVYMDRVEQDRKLLVYSSIPLAEQMEVTGHPQVRLYVTSTAVDGNFFAYLEDVDEQGRVTYVTEGMLRAIHRKLSSRTPLYHDLVPYHSFNRADAAPLEPGEVTELAFDLLPTSYLFRAGHRVRLALAGADRDHFFVPPGEPPVLRFYRDSEHSSRIDLPVISRG